MKSCRLTKQDILRAVDGELPVGEVLSMDAHLEDCASCRSYRDEQLSLNELLELLPEPALDRLDAKAAMASIQDSIDEHVGRGQQALSAQTERAAWDRALRSSVSKRWAMGLALLAASLLFAFGAWTWIQPEPLKSLPVAELRPLLLTPNEAPVEIALGQPSGEQTPAGMLEVPAEPQPITPAEVQVALRQALLQTFSNPHHATFGEHTLEFFDERMGSRYASWPLATMSESLLRDSDAQLAGAAARYLGLRGGRLSLASLKAGLQRPEVAPACVQALADLGPLGLDALGYALGDASLRGPALARLEQVPDANSAELIGAALLRGPRDPLVIALFLNALTLIGSNSIPTLLTLAQAESVPRMQVIGAMAALDDVGRVLARQVSVQDVAYPDELIFELVDFFGSAEMLPWLERKLDSYEQRQRALQSLAGISGVGPLVVLADLAQKGSLSEPELLQAFGALARANAGRMQQHAENMLAAGDALAASQYLSLLISCDEPGAANALALLAVSDLLTGEERQWAALAVGELGLPEAASILAAAFAAGELSERRLMAACLISVFRSLGEEGVHEALGSYPLGAVNAVFDALVDATTDPKPQEGAVQLFRIARVLNLATNGRNSNLGQSSL